MRDLNPRQRDLFGYVTTYAQDYGMDPLGVLRQFQRGWSTHTDEQRADFDAVAASLADGQTQRSNPEGAAA